MTQYETMLSAIRRPRTLIRAARHGATRYRRERDLKFMASGVTTQSIKHLLATLIERENDLEITRKSGGAGYNIAQHVTILTALIAEVRAAAQAPTAG